MNRQPADPSTRDERLAQLVALISELVALIDDLRTNPAGRPKPYDVVPIEFGEKVFGRDDR